MRESFDPYMGPGGALINRLGITDPDKLKVAEQDAAHFRMAMLRESPIKGNYDLKHLQETHRYIFQDVYPWAGEIRTVGMSKPPSEFARPEYIETEANKLFKQLAAEKHLKGLHSEQFVDRAAFFFVEVNAVHAFREGNGRCQQAFFEQLSRDAGRPLDFSKVQRDTMILGATLAHNKGHEFFKPIIESALREGNRQRDAGFSR